MVVFYHLAVFSHLTFLPIVRHAYLFVDFFFILSGFVIMGAYGQSLRQGGDRRRFLLLRWGRVYPLHLAMMGPFILILAVKGGWGAGLWEAVATNLLMVHGLGLRWIAAKTLGGLNFPSWSISAEFAAYVIFALIITWPVALFRTIVAATIITCPIVILAFSPALMNTTFDDGIFRCLYGFALGIVCYEIHGRVDWTAYIRSGLARTLVELASMGLAIVLVVRLDDTNRLTVAVPVVFALVVTVLARDAGLVSRALLCRPWQWIGALSYSIYMVHALVQVLMRAAGYALQRATHHPVFTPMRFGPGTEDLLGTTPWQGDVALVIMLAATLALAALTYRFIEEPARLWSRRLSVRPAAWTIPARSLQRHGGTATDGQPSVSLPGAGP